MRPKYNINGFKFYKLFHEKTRYVIKIHFNEKEVTLIEYLGRHICKYCHCLIMNVTLIIFFLHICIVFQAAIDHLETEVVRYFSLVPKGIYISAPLPSYNRMLLHSIVRYYSLDAMSK